MAVANARGTEHAFLRACYTRLFLIAPAQRRPVSTYSSESATRIRGGEARAWERRTARGARLKPREATRLAGRRHSSRLDVSVPHQTRATEGGRWCGCPLGVLSLGLPLLVPDGGAGTPTPQGGQGGSWRLTARSLRGLPRRACRPSTCRCAPGCEKCTPGGLCLNSKLTRLCSKEDKSDREGTGAAENLKWPRAPDARSCRVLRCPQRC